MAIVRISEPPQTLRDTEEITEYLASIGIDYDQWAPSHSVPADAPEKAILEAYVDEIEKLEAQGGYVAADVIDVHAETPGLEEMLNKFNREHTHADDEVRFIISGHGLFHIHPRATAVVAIEVEAGDLIRVPKDTWHWFDLCADRRIRAIRLFTDPAGWTPYYTESGVEQQHQPVCLGPTYIPPQIA